MKNLLPARVVLAATGVLLMSLAVGAANVDVFTLEGAVRTNAFKQAEFKWAVHPRHDYSKTYVTKLFLSQAEFDPLHLRKYKMRDNGKQKVYMSCEQALEVIKGMDALTLGNAFREGVATREPFNFAWIR